MSQNQVYYRPATTQQHRPKNLIAISVAARFIVLSSQLQIAKAGSGFAAFEAAAQALFLAALGANFFPFFLFLCPHGALEGEADLPFFAIDAQDLHIQL